jgi:RHS repeat-associated protein
MNNRTAIRDAVGLHQYGYDGLYRLTKADDPNCCDRAYYYDPAGNRLVMTGIPGDPVMTYSYNNGNLLASVNASGGGTETITWDKAGNLIGRIGTQGTFSYAFDGANRLTKAQGPQGAVNYGYDADGRQVRREDVKGMTWFVHDGLSVVMELGADRKPVNIIIPGVSRTRLDLHEPLTEYYLYDGLGSVVQMTDALGNLTQEYLYDPFGSVRNARNDPFNRYRFVGLAHDDATGLIYMNARWYDPQAGRFLSRDPVAGAMTDTQSLNLYPYVGNNPLNRRDITGLEEEEEENPQKEAMHGEIREHGPGSHQHGEDYGTTVRRRMVEPIGAGGKSIGGGGRGSGFWGWLTSFRRKTTANQDPSSNSRAEPGAGTAKVESNTGTTEAPGGSSGTATQTKAERPGTDPTKPPGEGWVWRGQPGSRPGIDPGGWFNPRTGESYHPDYSHPGQFHYDYRIRLQKRMIWRYDPVTGKYELKKE